MPTNESCVLNLTMDEGTGPTAFDTSGHDNNGTLVNGPAWSVLGVNEMTLAVSGLTVPSGIAGGVFT